ILDMLRRTLLFWLGLACKIAFYGAVVVAALWLWQRGVDGALADSRRLALGWSSEYASWRDRAEGARLVREQVGGAAVGGRAGGRGGAWW
ncbi:hypothetical protein LTR16_001177, partial [Cryomyces antarcticus]